MPDRMRELVDRINRLNYHYYVLDDPIASDDEWDALYRELADMERSQGRVLEDSPTRLVGGEPISAFEQTRHLARLYSMNKGWRNIIKPPSSLWTARNILLNINMTA